MKPKRHLVKNALGHYYVRIYVPKDLRPLLRKNELRRTLQTTCEATAIHRSAEKIYQIKQYFESIREQCNMPIKADEWALASKMLKIDGFKKDGDGFSFESLRSDGTSEDRATLALILGEEVVDELFAEPDREKRAAKIAEHIRTSTTETAPKKRTDIPKIREYLNLFIERRIASGKSFGTGAQRSYINAVELFTDLFGDRTVDWYTERNAMDYRHLLRMLPVKFRQRKPYMYMTTDQLIECEADATLASATIAGYLQRMRTLFRDLDDRRTLVEFNIFKDVTVAVTKTRKYLPYAHNELCELFSKDNVQVSKTYPSHFWVPLIALFTGMRRSEIFFRTVSDIRLEGNIEYIDINTDDDKKTKNEASVRQIPIHNYLKKIGFLKYVQRIQDEHGENARLFPEYKDHGNQSGNKFTDWFIGYRKEAGVTSVGKVFHSFRSNFINELEKRNSNTYHIQQLAGHSIHSTTHDSKKGYGGKASIAELKETIDEINFTTALLELPKWYFDA